VIIDKLVTAEKNNETDEKFKKEVYKNFVFTLSNKLLSF